MTATHWYRVRLDSDGRAVSCERTDVAPSADHAGVYYVQATDSVGAQAAAYEQYLLRQREAMAQRRAALKARGLCRCGGELGRGERQCKRCRERNLADRRRSAERRHGADVRPPPKSAAFQATRETRERRLLMSELIEVRAAYAKLSHNEFGAWLDDRIRSLAGVEVAA